MGETVELLAREYSISREASDRYALETQQKAERAINAGVFTEEIAPVTHKDAKGKDQTLTADEHPRSGTTTESLQKLPLVFSKVEGQAGIITAGSSSGITDGGAALIVAGSTAVTTQELKPLVKILGWASAGVDPRRMGIGPVPAVQKLLRKTGLAIDDFDLVELNEAFAAQVLAVLKDLPIRADRLNVNGGAIALGHPIGATGTRIVVTLIYEMLRRKARRGLATLCVSGGMGMAIAFERCE
jgi:acetyl-CoA C-acetyltransferase